MTPLRIFVGFDDRETVAYHVLCHSILARASVPVAITPLVLSQLRASGLYTRDRTPAESTDFAFSRFLVPALCNFDGLALFMDCDMICRTDIARAFLRPQAARPGDKAVWLCPHSYTPRQSTKFLGQAQATYPRKNWSSFMIFDCAQCHVLTPDFVNTATGKTLHRFEWLRDDQIEALPLSWNYLVDEDEQFLGEPNVVHFTNGTPCFPEYAACEYSDEWFRERDAMLAASVQQPEAA